MDSFFSIDIGRCRTSIYGTHFLLHRHETKKRKPQSRYKDETKKRIFEIIFIHNKIVFLYTFTYKDKHTKEPSVAPMKPLVTS